MYSGRGDINGSLILETQWYVLTSLLAVSGFLLLDGTVRVLKQPHDLAANRRPAMPAIVPITDITVLMMRYVFASLQDVSDDSVISNVETRQCSMYVNQHDNTYRALSGKNVRVHS